MLHLFYYLKSLRFRKHHFPQTIRSRVFCVYFGIFNFPPLITMYPSPPPPSRPTYQYYKARPVTGPGQVLCHFFINQEIGVIGIWSVSFTGRAVTLLPVAEAPAQTGCGHTHTHTHTQMLDGQTSGHALV